MYWYFFSFLWPNNIPCVDGPHLFIHSPADGHLGIVSSLLSSLASLTSSRQGVIYATSRMTFFLSWPLCTAGGVLAPQPGVEPLPPAMKAQSPKH